MKKFYAIVLGLALVLGMASIASADFSATGKITLQWMYDGAYTTGLVDDSNMKLTVSKAWGPASGKLVLKADADAAPLTVAVDSYQFAYKFSDAFTLTAAKKFEVKSPIFETKADIGAVALYGVYTFDGGKFQAGTNMKVDALDFAAAAEFAFDPLTVGAVFDYTNGGAYKLGPYVKYALTDELTLTGDLLYTDTGDLNVAAEAAYETDLFTAVGGIDYDIDGTAGLGWNVEGSYAAAENLELSAEFNSDNEYELKAALTIEAGPVLSISYNEASELKVKLEASF